MHASGTLLLGFRLLAVILTASPTWAVSGAEPEPAAESQVPDNAAGNELATIPVQPEETGAEEAVPADPESTSTKITEIIVTATKREESVRDVPISIDAFSGEDLAQRGVKDLEGLLKYSPGVILKKGSASDSSNITIRGIGGTSKYFNRTFGLFYQDVSLVNPSLAGAQPDIDPFDMRTVEVLKGPQGTLFGGSALAGAVRYVPTPPSLDEAARRSCGSTEKREGVMSELQWLEKQGRD